MEVATRRDVTLREEYLLKVWDSYIRDNLVDSTPCRAALYDWRTRRLIVASQGFHLLDAELGKVTEAMKYPHLAYMDGVTVQTRRYNVRLADGKNGIYATDGEHGCTVCKTSTLLIVGVNDERVRSGTCNEEVMKLGDYFRRLGL